MRPSACRLYFLLAALEGVGALALLFGERSMERRALFLGYSGERLILGALTLTLIALLAWATGRAFRDQAWLAELDRWVDQRVLGAGRLPALSAALASLLLIGAAAVIAMRAALLSTFLPFVLVIGLERVAPLLLWAMAVAGQSLVLLWMLKPRAFRQQMLQASRTYVFLAVTAMILAASLLRLCALEDPNFSIATADTLKFIRSARIPLGSLDFWTSNRPPTIALAYKLLEPAQGYEIVGVSEPAVSGTTGLALHPGLHRVVNLQLAAALLGWFTLAVVLARQLGHPVTKLVGALLVLLFASSPQLTDWDRVLMSESISFSLFALVLALTIELSVSFARDGPRLSAPARLLAGLWLVVTVLWVFSRDSNAYLLLTTVAALIPLLVVPKLRQQVAFRALALLVVCLSLTFAFHNLTLNRSDRWINPFFNNLIRNVLPDQARVAFFERQGMPVSQELLALQSSRGNELGFYELPEFMDWVVERGSSTYMLFLLSEPGWSIKTLLESMPALFSENIQPYFHARLDRGLQWLSHVGNTLHPTAAAIALIDVVLTLAILALAGWRRDRQGLALGWVFVWLLLGEMAMLFVSFHGDSLARIRHTLVSVLPLRLSLWLLSVFAIDQGIAIGRALRSTPHLASPKSSASNT